MLANSGHNHKMNEVPVEVLDKLGYDFIPLSFEASGGCTPEAEKLINAILVEKSRMTSIPFSEVVSDFWQLLSITLQRSNAHMIRRRLAHPKPLFIPERLAEPKPLFTNPSIVGNPNILYNPNIPAKADCSI